MTRLVIFLLLPIFCFGQNQYNQWHFGYNAKLDFNSGVPVPSTQSAMSSIEGAASVADCDGNLLFYTNGEIVWTKNHSMMDNGYDLKGESSLYSSTQSSLIVKRPKSAFIYYVFTASDIYGIAYSIINMQANNGLGRVIQKNVILDNKPSQKLAVTYHQNGEDIWVITHYENSNEFESFKVTKTGVSSNSVSSYNGPKHTSGHGDMKFNQQGTKVASVVQDQDLVSISDFNKSSGVVFNTSGITDRYDFPHGVDFSPAGNFMYVSAWGSDGGVFQFDLSLGHIQALSKGKSLSGSFKPQGSLQLAPDGKIYIADDQSFYLGVINFPDNAGFSAFFSQNGLYLGGRRSSWELTNVTLNSNVVVAPNGFTSSDYCFNTSTNFSILSELGVVSVLWDFDDPGSGINNSSVQYYPDHEFSAPGVYTVRLSISTECGTEEYQETVVIEDGPHHPMNNEEVCKLADKTIGVSPVAGESYSWSPSTGLSNVNISNPVFNSSGINQNTLKYYLTSTSSIGCDHLDSIEIILLDLPLAGKDQFQCPGFDVQLMLDGSIVSALWSPGINIDNPNALNPNFSSNSSQYAYVDLVDSNGCVNSDSVWVEVGDSIPVEAGIDTVLCEGDTLRIGEGDPLSNGVYSWSPSLNLMSPNELLTKAFPVTSQLYTVTVSIDTCSRSDSIFLTVNAKPNIQINPSDTSICKLDSLTLIGNNGVDYTWYTIDGQIGNSMSQIIQMDTSIYVFINGVDTNGCENQDTVLLTELQLPEVELTNDTSICIGDSIDLVVSGGVQYEWLNHGVIGSPDSLVKVEPTNTKTYVVKVTGNNTCSTEDSVEIKVNELPIIDMFKDTLICEGTSAKLWATGGVKYKWSPANFLSTTTFRDSSVFPVDSITYQVIVTDEHGCVDSSSSRIDLNVNPEANYSFTILPTCLGYEVQFTDSSVNADTYQWNYGDGGSSTDKDPFYIYDYSTVVNTSLIVGNNAVCFDTLTTSFTWSKIGDFIDIFVPNIITPNSDGVNECFEVVVPSEFEDCVEFEIYNRWGLKVYDTRDFHANFCGYNAYNNQELSEGTYFYVIEINNFVTNGFVNIAR